MDDERKFDPVTSKAKDDMRPDFLAGRGNSESDSNNSGEAADALRGAEQDASKSSPNGTSDDINDVRDGEQEPRGFYRGGNASSRLSQVKAKGKFISRIKKFGPVGIVVILVLVFLVISTVIIPIVVGSIKENLISTLGFKDTVGILEKVAEYKIKNALAEGKMPEELAADFDRNGLEIGQVTIAGEFVPTHRYLAELDGAEVAGTGKYKNNSQGELSLRFNGEIINADNFVAAVESSPTMYAAYSKALDISTRYYYSDEVNDVYNSMGISRNPFAGWTSTGDAETDRKSFNQLLANALDVKYDLDTSGDYKDWEEYEEPVKEIINGVEVITSYVTRRECEKQEWNYNSNDSVNSTDRLISKIELGSRSNAYGNEDENAAQLLNATIAAGEPYLSAAAFMAAVSSIEQAQVGNNGPVNEMMNAFTTGTKVTYTDVNTGKEKTDTRSIFETTNFTAAVANGSFSKEEANNFSLDRVFRATSLAKPSVISNTVVSMNGEESGLGFRMASDEGGDYECEKDPASGALTKSAGIADLSLGKKSSEVFSSVVGGNRIIEGGAGISNTLNQHVLGAMPSDMTTILSYHDEVSEIIARQAEADRATRSPFDISSPNTFLGSLVRSLAATFIKGYSSSEQTVINKLSSTVASLLGSSLSSLGSGVMADDNQSAFTTLSGDCDTVNTVGVEGNLYCDAHRTISTVNMDYTDAKWQSVLSDSFNADGEIKEDSELGKFILSGTDREATFGVKSATICQRNKPGGLAGIIRKITNFFRSLIHGASELENECSDIEPDVATGKNYTFSAKNSNSDRVKLLSAYILHDRVSSFLSDEESNVTAFRNKYYEEHPLDNSYEGILARRTGLSKNEIQIALNYGNELIKLALYNPAERYNFMAVFEPYHDNVLSFYRDTSNLALFFGLGIKEFEYQDIRNRSFAV